MATHGEEEESQMATASGIEKPVGKITQMNTTSVALAAALAEEKPDLWSKSMIRLYFIMGIGYLVSTMNGFGMVPLHTGRNAPTCAADLIQTAPSWERSMP